MPHQEPRSSASLAPIPNLVPRHPLVSAWREATHREERHALERLIRRRFADDHGAAISHFLPRLFGLWQGAVPLAVVGVGHASEGSLFQERYLDSPAEVFLSAHLGQPVPRDALAEIGNLATRRHGLQGRLFVHLIDQLVAEGLGWVLFTATPAVANGLARLGIALVPLMPADPARLGEAQADWGRYYTHHPQVMAGNLRRAHAELCDRGLLPAPREVAHAHHA